MIWNAVYFNQSNILIVIGNNISIRGIELKTKAEILELPQKKKHLIEILSQRVHSNEEPHRYKQNVLFFLYINMMLIPPSQPSIAIISTLTSFHIYIKATSMNRKEHLS